MVSRIIRLIGLAGVLLVGGFAVFVATRQNLRFDAPYPAVAASADSAVIARGRYLVRTAADCGACHGDPERAGAADEEAPLSGGSVWQLPPGVFHAPNITPDSATGIGAASDGAIARALRHGVGIDGRALLPFMEMQGLADDDLVAIVSYLRTQPSVANAVPPHEYNLLGRVVRATVLADPIGPAEPPPAVAPRAPGIETGRYLAGSVSNCWACHTERNQSTGELMGPRYAGARFMPGGAGTDTTWAPPNLTPDPRTGRLLQLALDEDGFVERMRAGRLLPGSPMPWDTYRRMSEDDLRSVYRFLMSLPAVEHDVGPSVRTGT